MPRAHRAAALIPLLVAVLGLNACAVSPYIANTRPASTEPGTGLSARGTLDYALVYADATYDAYQAKLTEEYTRQQQLSAGLLTAGTLMVGAAIGGAHRDVLLTLGLGSGLAYQLGSWNSNQGRLGIYVEGMKALTCAKAAVAPLRLGTDHRQRITAAEGELRTAVDHAGNAAADTTHWLSLAAASPAPNAELLQSARSELTEAGAAFTQANDLLGRSAALAQKADGAGALLETKIDEIRRLIDSALNGTLAQLSSLPQQIASIADYANIFAPGLQIGTAFRDRIGVVNGQLNPKSNAQAKSGQDRSAAENAMRTPQATSQLAAAIGRLRGARVLLGARLATLSGAVDRPVAQVQSDLAGCGVDNAKLSHGITLDPPVIQLTAGQAGSAWASVAGGTTPYVATPMQTPMPGITVAAPAGGAVVMVNADATTTAGATYLVRVEDAAKASATLTISVVAGNKSGTARTTAATASCSGFKGKSRAQLCAIQKKAQVNLTGAFDDATCTGFFEHVSDDGLLNDDSMALVMKDLGLGAAATDAEISAKLSKDELRRCQISATGTAEAKRTKPVTSTQPASVLPGARNDYERTLSAGNLQLLGQKLKMRHPPRDLTDDTLRDAVARFQRDRGLPQTRGELTKPLFDQITLTP